MITILFDKSRAEHFIDCIKNHKAIECRPGGWTQGDVVALAGAMFATAFGQGAPSSQDVEQFKSRHAEHREMIQATFAADLHFAIDFFSSLTFKVMDGEFDAQFEPIVEAMIEGETKKMRPIRGFRQLPEGGQAE
jgi:hypothetical protein